MLEKLRAFHNDPNRRPYSHIAFLLVLMLPYLAAQSFVGWVEDLL